MTKKKNKKLIGAIVLVSLSLVLYFMSHQKNLCETCSGLNVINPLCWIGYTNCKARESIINTVLFFSAILLFVFGIFRLIGWSRG